MHIMHSANIDIVITCFNYAQYVGLAVESAIRQTYVHKEISPSTMDRPDNSPEVITRYADRVRIIEQPNLVSIAASWCFIRVIAGPGKGSRAFGIGKTVC